MTKILIAHDSALVRQVLYDIISKNVDDCEIKKSLEGESALKTITEWQPGYIFLDMFLQKKNGCEIINELFRRNIKFNAILMGSLAQEDRDAAAIFSNRKNIVFFPIPYRVTGSSYELFERDFLRAAKKLKLNSTDGGKKHLTLSPIAGVANMVVSSGSKKKSAQLIAIASSTGGPQALHRVIPKIKRVGVPIVIVQHMPKGFTYSLAQRIDVESFLTVTEAKDGEELKADHVYIAPGGFHLKVIERNNKLYNKVFDAPPVNSLKPCADIMFESLIDTNLDSILCVVLTGMGRDGTEGIVALSKKKNIRVISEAEKSCVVYGMPRSIDETGLTNVSAEIDEMARVIVNELEG